MRDSETKNTVKHEGSISMRREKVAAEERIEVAKRVLREESVGQKQHDG